MTETIIQPPNLNDLNALLMARRSALGKVDRPSDRPTRSVFDAGNQMLDTARGMSADASRFTLTVEASAEIIVEPDPLPASTKPLTVALYGDLTARLVKSGHATTGRVWAVLRGLCSTENTSGWVSADTLRTIIEAEFGFTWRRSRQILNNGMGGFWTADSVGRYWLHSQRDVFAALGGERFSGRRVQIPLSDLTGKLKRARAAFLAAFTNGSNPITRETIRQETGISERTQQQLSAENPDLLQSKSNFSLQPETSNDTRKNAAYEDGRATFAFKDHHGKQGRAGQQYTARRLPNSYPATLETAPKGRKRKDNKRLTGRVNQEARGNGGRTVERVFYTDRRKAIRAATHTRQGGSTFLEANTTSKGGGIWLQI